MCHVYFFVSAPRYCVGWVVKHYSVQSNQQLLLVLLRTGSISRFVCFEEKLSNGDMVHMNVFIHLIQNEPL